MTIDPAVAAAARRRLSALPTAGLATWPTPLQRLDRFSERIGGEVWIKRDDIGEIGLAGNKVRKYELVLGAALAGPEPADTVITTGAVQSNSARAAAAACARLGLRCILVLTGEPPAAARANLLLDGLFGAQVRLPGVVSWAALGPMLEDIAAEVRSAGGRPVVAPIGCSSPLGALGFARAWFELVEDCERVGIAATSVVHTTTSAGTHAGLVAGRCLDPRPDRPTVVGVDAGRLFGAQTAPAHARLTTDALALLGVDHEITAQDLHLVDDQIGEGYGIATEAGMAALRLLAATEGIVVDPVYSAKGLAHVVATVAATDGPVVFWHTGGFHALFDPRYGDAVTGAA